MRDFVFIVIAIIVIYGAGSTAGRRSIRDQFNRLMNRKGR